MFLKKLYIFFWKLEDRHDGKFKKILDVSKIKKTMTSKFILRLFSMETSEERHSRGMHDLLFRLLSLLVLLARLETKRRSFNADLFSTRFFPPLRRSFFFFFRFRSYFEVEISFSFFFLFS